MAHDLYRQAFSHTSPPLFTMHIAHDTFQKGAFLCLFKQELKRSKVVPFVRGRQYHLMVLELAFVFVFAFSLYLYLCVSLFVMMSIVLVEQEPESKVVPSVKGAASSICYGPVDRLFIVARYTNTHSLADTQLLLPPKHNRCLFKSGT